MNSYGDWWDSTITLYNRVKDSNGKIKWYRHVIDDCFYRHTLDKITMKNTTITSDVSVCRIRVSEDFIPKRQYDELDEISKATMFTVSVGDIVVPEETDFEIDDYKQGSRSSDLKEKFKAYPGCFTAETVSINVGGGRGNEHYLIRGV